MTINRHFTQAAAPVAATVGGSVVKDLAKGVADEVVKNPGSAVRTATKVITGPVGALKSVADSAGQSYLDEDFLDRLSLLDSTAIGRYGGSSLNTRRELANALASHAELTTDYPGGFEDVLDVPAGDHHHLLSAILHKHHPELAVDLATSFSNLKGLDKKLGDALEDDGTLDQAHDAHFNKMESALKKLKGLYK